MRSQVQLQLAIAQLRVPSYAEECSCEHASRHRRARAHEGVAQPQLVGGQQRCGCERQAADEQRHGQRDDASESALRGYLLLAESYEGTGEYQIKFKRTVTRDESTDRDLVLCP